MTTRSTLPIGWRRGLATAFVLTLLGIASAQAPVVDPAGEARRIADQATSMAREGRAKEALDLYRAALELNSASMEIRRDYAVTLGWAEKYLESRQQFDLVRELEPDQPVWALREMARSELFGDEPAAALVLLERLIELGDRSEATMIRKGLALRWLGRGGEAELAYRAALDQHPDSVAAQIGTVYAQADREQLGRALQTVEQALAQHPGNWELLKAKGQVLNWTGLHLEAQRVLDSIPPEHASEREVRESRAAAARWGRQPLAAQRIASSLAAEFPRNRSVVELHQDLEREFGYAFGPTARIIEHSDGLVDRTYAQDFALHANPAHRVDFGYQYRRFSQEGDSVLAWRRYGAGWGGTLSRRLSMFAAVSSVDYLHGSPGQRFFPEGSATYFFGDRARLMAGVGKLPMDAFPSVRNRVTAGYYQSNLLLRPQNKLTVEAQYARYDFSNDVSRDRVDLTAFRRLYGGRRLRLDLGARSNFLWHDHETPDFFSPTSFQTHLAAVRTSGRLSERLEYTTEVGFGVQREPFVKTQSPLAVSGALSFRLWPSLYLSFEAGRSTASIERVNPGRPSYSRRFASVSLNVRLPRAGENGGDPLNQATIP